MTIWHKLRNHLTHLLAWGLDQVERKPEPPHPDALARAKNRPHYFVIKITYDETGGHWLAEYSGIEREGFRNFTQGATLPDALAMAGDLGRLNLEYMLSQNTYPFEADTMQDLTFTSYEPDVS